MQISTKAYGLLAAFLATASFAAKPAHASEFLDTFATSNFLHTEAGVAWNPPNSTAGLGLDPAIASGAPCTTTCVEFQYIGNADPNHNGHSEISFTHIPGLDEVTVEWQQFFPATWAHRDPPSGGNANQFFAFIPPAGGITIEANFVVDGTGAEKIEVRHRTGAGPWSVVGTGNGVVPGGGVPSKLGVWLPVRVYVKRSTGGSSDGTLQMTLNGDVIVDRNDLTLAPAAGRLVSQGRFMGFALSGFAADSSTFVDDITVTIPRQETAGIGLAIDRSGSMQAGADATVPPADPQFIRKIDAAKTAAQAALQTLKPYLNEQDKVGAVFFNQDAPPTSLADASPVNVDALATSISTGPAASGATSVGDGLDSASVLDGETLDYKLVLLLTDGYQNRPLFVVEGGGSTLAGSGSQFFLGPDRFDTTTATAYPADLNVCVLSLGIGTQQMQWFNQALNSRRCRDFEAQALSATDIANLESGDPAMLSSFTSTIMTALEIGDRLEKVAEAEASVDAGESATQSFVVSRNDIRISIPMVWAHRDLDSDDLTLELLDPNGERILLDPGRRKAFLLESNGQSVPLADIQYDQGNRHMVVSFPLPLDEDRLPSFAGDWRLKISREVEDSTPSDIGLLFLADNSSVATDFNVMCDDCGTGDEIALSVRLVDRGAAVAGASVVATISSPDDSVGNALSSNDTPDPTDPGTDPLSPAEQKLQALLENPKIRASLIGLLRPPVTLTDHDGDGVYTGTYRATEVAGNYEVTFDVDATSAANGRFVRTQTQSLNVRAKPDPSRTKFKIELVEGEPGINAVLTFTPVDRFGNFVGPGFADLIDVTGEGELVGTPLDRLDGSYELKLNLTDPSKRPNIGIEFAGDKVDVDTNGPDWRWLLLLLLLIPLLA